MRSRVLFGLGVLATVSSVGSSAQPQAMAGGSDRGVQVFDAGASAPSPCRPVDPRGGRFVRGGCRVRATADDAVLSIRTAFGRLHFGDCPIYFDLTFSADGRIWIDNIEIAGESPCSDIWPCAPARVIAMRTKVTYGPPPAHVPPWQGELVAAPDGGLAGRFRLCVDSCVGRYVGTVRTTLVRTHGEWIMRARLAAVGDTPLEVDATWRMTGSFGFDLKSRAGSSPSYRRGTR
jgi:hypothetical protein